MCAPCSRLNTNTFNNKKKNYANCHLAIATVIGKTSGWNEVIVEIAEFQGEWRRERIANARKQNSEKKMESGSGREHTMHTPNVSKYEM